MELALFSGCDQLTVLAFEIAIPSLMDEFLTDSCTRHCHRPILSFSLECVLSLPLRDIADAGR